MKILKKAFVCTIALGIVLFSVPLLTNIHNLYLRSISSWTVMITNSTGTSGATGFIARGRSGEKYVITNNHVCGLAENGVLIIRYGSDVFQAEVYKPYQYNDLCALKVHRDLGTAAGIAAAPVIGESAWVIGHPLLEPKTVSVGELSATVFIPLLVSMFPKENECNSVTYHTGMIFDTIPVCYRLLQANASTTNIQPGNSGSPVVNMFGNVIAVAFAANEAGTRSYFVPLSDLKDFLSEL